MEAKLLDIFALLVLIIRRIRILSIKIRNKFCFLHNKDDLILTGSAICLKHRTSFI